MNRKAARILAATATVGVGATVVEIGCVRFDREIGSDGWSTVYLARRAKRRAWRFSSVDVDESAIAKAAAACEGLPVSLVCDDGERFLRGYGHMIDCLYLDGGGSSLAALGQYRAARLAPGAVVIVDDCQPFDDQPAGKATHLIGRLERDGFDAVAYDTEPGYRMLVAARSAA